jgi:hypothetical protein
VNVTIGDIRGRTTELAVISRPLPFGRRHDLVNDTIQNGCSFRFWSQAPIVAARYECLARPRLIAGTSALASRRRETVRSDQATIIRPTSRLNLIDIPVWRLRQSQTWDRPTRTCYGGQPQIEQRNVRMKIIDPQVHAYEANTSKRPWHSVPS